MLCLFTYSCLFTYALTYSLALSRIHTDKSDRSATDTDTIERVRLTFRTVRSDGQNEHDENDNTNEQTDNENENFNSRNYEDEKRPGTSSSANKERGESRGEMLTNRTDMTSNTNVSVSENKRESKRERGGGGEKQVKGPTRTLIVGCSSINEK